jgi:hypothetical protein
MEDALSRSALREANPGILSLDAGVQVENKTFSRRRPSTTKNNNFFD